MDLKTDMKNAIQLIFKDNASTFFLNRVLNVIDEAPDDMDSLLSAADRVSKTVAFFIDKSLAKEISNMLENKIKETHFSKTNLSNISRFNTYPPN